MAGSTASTILLVPGPETTIIMSTLRVIGLYLVWLVLSEILANAGMLAVVAYIRPDPYAGDFSAWPIFGILFTVTTAVAVLLAWAQRLLPMRKLGWGAVIVWTVLMNIASPFTALVSSAYECAAFSGQTANECME